jgi:general secretion pathway protein G
MNMGVSQQGDLSMIVTTRIRPSSRRPALTLMEVMVVAAILVILAGVGAIGVLAYLGEAKEKAAKAQIQTIETAVNSFYLDYNTYPNTLADLTVVSQDGKAAKLPQTAIIDPWGVEYGYEPNNVNPNTKVPHIFSNNEPGSGKAQISNW